MGGSLRPRTSHEDARGKSLRWPRDIKGFIVSPWTSHVRDPRTWFRRKDRGFIHLLSDGRGASSSRTRLKAHSSLPRLQIFPTLLSSFANAAMSDFKTQIWILYLKKKKKDHQFRITKYITKWYLIHNPMIVTRAENWSEECSRWNGFFKFIRSSYCCLVLLFHLSCMHMPAVFFLIRDTPTYLVSAAVRFRVISRGYPKSIAAILSPSRPARYRLIRPIYLRRPHNVASITPSGSINKLRSRDIYRLHTGELFLRPHSPDSFDMVRV